MDIGQRPFNLFIFCAITFLVDVSISRARRNHEVATFLLLRIVMIYQIIRLRLSNYIEILLQMALDQNYHRLKYSGDIM